MAWNKETVVTLRHLTGLSQTKFARLYGFNVETLRQWEVGRHCPDTESCKKLDITFAEIRKKSDEAVARICANL